MNTVADKAFVLSRRKPWRALQLVDEVRGSAIDAIVAGEREFHCIAPGCRRTATRNSNLGQLVINWRVAWRVLHILKISSLSASPAA